MSKMSKLRFHLIANAHLDPVWLWDWREGFNEGVITCRTMLDLMDEYPHLTFIRGEAAIYEHIERTDPATFDRIRRYVRQGRWDVVGGTYIQADTNMPATETFARQYARGQQYFLSRFGKSAQVAWAADSFGHAAGLPEVMAQAGIKGFAFTRPGAVQLPLPKPAFWWVGAGGSRVMAYRPVAGWYGNERDEMPRKLDLILEAAGKCDLQNVAVFYGVGNHGGGATRRMLRDIEAWSRQHGQVEVIHSGLHRFFATLYAEVRRHGEDFLPTHRGEMNFVQRGCYSSAARLKFMYRKTESLVAKVQTTDAAIAASLATAPGDLGRAWDAVLFNSFHDILPGSSIERAYDDQVAQLGGALRGAQEVELAALNALAAQVDTHVAKPQGDMPSAVAAIVFNPHPQPIQTYVELEASLDYRPILAYKDRPQDLPTQLLGPDRRPLPFQAVATEHHAFMNFAWRRRVVAPMKLPALGYGVLEFAYVNDPRLAPLPRQGAKAPRDGVIDNGIYRVRARCGKAGIDVFLDGKRLFGPRGLTAIVADDLWGSWGAMDDRPQCSSVWDPRETWSVTDVRTLERGPLRAAMWVRLAGRSDRSSLELTFSVCAGRRAVDVSARVMWNERSSRLRLVMPCGCREAQFDVPGAAVTRRPCGEVPGGRWVRVHGRGGTFGFASDALYSFECKDGKFSPTVCRASRYGADASADARQDPHLPAVDRGELKFKFLLTPGDESLPREADLLQQPPTVLLVPARPGKLPREGSLAAIEPAEVRLLTIAPAADGKGFIVRLQNCSAAPVAPRLTWGGRTLKLDKVPAGQIACWRLKRGKRLWSAVRTDLTER